MSCLKQKVTLVDIFCTSRICYLGIANPAITSDKKTKAAVQKVRQQLNITQMPANS